MEKITATVVDVKIHKVVDLWGRKPKGVRFEDTDAIVVIAKTNDGKEIRETFYTCVKPDGTFNLKTLNKSSGAKRLKLANFLKHYGFADNVEDYNIPQKAKEWIGKKVDVVIHGNGGFISIP